MITATTPATLELVGASGRRYTFYVYPWGTLFKPQGGVYAVTRAVANQTGGNNHTILYVGQTGDLSERFDQHHKEPCFRRNAATHLCVTTEANEQNRLAIEADLVRAYNPPCNG